MVTGKAVVVGALGMVPNGLEKRLGVTGESWRPKETCCLSDFSEKLPVKTGMKSFDNNNDNIKQK